MLYKHFSNEGFLFGNYILDLDGTVAARHAVQCIACGTVYMNAWLRMDHVECDRFMSVAPCRTCGKGVFKIITYDILFTPEEEEEC